MSKGFSHLFINTLGAGKELISHVQTSGFKISSEDVILITRNPSGQIVWMEKGNDRSGLQHIINRHGSEFYQIGISNIPNFVLEAVYQGNIIGTQGRRNPRAIYEVVYNGRKYHVAIQIGSNGYIVSANLRKIKE